MKPIGLCMSCMNGCMVDGVCCSCGATLADVENRMTRALPADTFLHNRYYIGKVLGFGGFGVTYIAWDDKRKSRVAIKELFPGSYVSRARDGLRVEADENQKEYIEHLKKRFLDEARLLADFLKNKEILNVYHLFPDNNTAYYAMEYMDGNDLKSFVKRNGKLNWSQMEKIMASVLIQLNILHARKFIHRDISPDNIFLPVNGSAKLIDFGSVRTYRNPESFDIFLKHNFAPIEQYYSESEQGPWTDIYALCVTAYYVLSGTLPPKATERVVKDNVIHIQELVPELPKYVADAIMVGMEVNKRDRFQSADELFAALRIEKHEDIDHRSTEVMMLQCTEGVMKGGIWPLEQNSPVAIGRGSKCNVRYPHDSPGISRSQLTIVADSKKHVFVRDDGSSFGTYINGLRISPNKWTEFRCGMTLSFAGEKFLLTSGRV